MRYLPFTVLVFLPISAICPPAVGQAVTEYGLGAGRAATTAAPARGAAGAIAGTLQNLSKAAGADATTASSPVNPSGSRSRRAAARGTGRRTQAKSAKSVDAPAVAQTPAPVYEDPRLIQAGMQYDEIVRRFGPPSMLVTTAPGTSTLWYYSRETTYQIDLRDGKASAAPGGASASTPQ